MSLSDKIFPPPKFGEPYLLTPGPLTTAYEVKEAMLKDWGSWDDDFRDLTKKLRKNLLSLLGPRKNLYDCVPIQGSGTFAVESMLGTFIPKDGKLGDIAPTVLKIMGVDIPDEMSANILI